MKLKEILLLIAVGTIVLSCAYLAVIICSGYDVKMDEVCLTEVL